ncbi:hypothetical protein PIB30_031872 [Stylosanthes scabra]|uniref:Uncharacterized protein n=1 Tax=Stylosanthes scabra TaxID=79078 RepID=A0ABU6VCS6_9FABA|nr:hypothetical protein [Stylosanthes scabra]
MEAQWNFVGPGWGGRRACLGPSRGKHAAGLVVGAKAIETGRETKLGKRVTRAWVSISLKLESEGYLTDGVEIWWQNGVDMNQPLAEVQVATIGSQADRWNFGADASSQESTVSATANTAGHGILDSDSEEFELEKSVRVVGGVGDFDEIDFGKLMEEDIRRFEFADLEATYEFYNEYGRIKGFSVQKYNMGKSTKVGSAGEILW